MLQVYAFNIPTHFYVDENTVNRYVVNCELEMQLELFLSEKLTMTLHNTSFVELTLLSSRTRHQAKPKPADSDGVPYCGA